MNINNHSQLHLGGLFLFVAATIGWAATTTASESVIEPVRLIVVGALVFLFSLSLVGRRFRITNRALLAISIYLALFVYGVFLSISFGDFDLLRRDVFIGFGLTILAIYFFGSQKEIAAGPTFAGGILIFCVMTFCLTVYWGGFVFDLPPHFVFERYTDTGRQIEYSQGVSKIYGVAAIAATYLAYESDSKSRTSLLLALSVAFILLSLLGGARGDSVIAVLVVAAYILRKRPTHFAVLFVSALIFWWKLPVDLKEHLLILERLSTLSDGDLGRRDELFTQALVLLGERPNCLVFGCGFDYFQAYYGFESNVYPHNFILEFAITFGAPLTILLFSLAAYGLVRTIRDNKIRRDAFPLLFFYFFLIGMKSGNVIGAWLLFSTILIFVATAVTKLPRASRTRSTNLA